jgi:hypothetical protein
MDVLSASRLASFFQNIQLIGFYGLLGSGVEGLAHGFTDEIEGENC